MNTKKMFLAALIGVIAVALLIAGSAAARSSESTFDCEVVSYVTTDPGNWSFPDGNLHIRGMQQVAQSVCEDSRVVGHNYITINANWDATMHGPMWGTFTFESDSGGTWSGTWNGKMTSQGSWYNAVGVGGGEFAGLKLWMDKDFDQLTGRILDPKGN